MVSGKRGNRKRSFDEFASSSPFPSSSSLSSYLLSAAELLSVKEASRKALRFCEMTRKNKLFVNTFFDFATKSAAIQVAPSVVSLVSFSGDDILYQSSGTIVEVQPNNITLVLTCLNLIRKITEHEVFENALAPNLKIVARTCDGKTYLSKIQAFDYHYNLLLLEFEAETPLRPATCRMLDDAPSHQVATFALRPHQPRSFKINSGDPVLIVGRYFDKKYELMASSGECLRDEHDPRWHREFDCQELLLSSSRITRCGDGGPVVNQAGEVIGVAYFLFCSASPFLPINVAHKWWKNYAFYKEFPHPYIGFEASNIYSVLLPALEKILQISSDIRDGLVVKKVHPRSRAESRGLWKNDVIIKCAGKSVNGFLQLWDLMWDKVGEAVDLEVLRAGLGTPLKISMMA